MEYKEFFLSVLEGATKIALLYFGKTNEIEKGYDNNQVLTAADLEIGTYIINRVKQAYPAYNIIDEEAGVIDNKSEYTFVIDPIDGTSNFANGLPHYATMFGLLHNGKSIAGGISLPGFNEIYYAESGKGTWLNGNRIHVSYKTDFAKTLGCYWIDGDPQNEQKTFKEGENLAKYALKLRNLRISNSAYDICKLAEGKYSVVVGNSSKIWDNVVAQIIVEEAGGVYWDGNKQPMRYKNIFDTSINYRFIIFAPQFESNILEITE